MYDYVIITHLPAFYKVNLYNQICKNLKIFVIFIGNHSTQRTKDFVSLNCNFEYKILTDGNFENRNVFKSIISLFRVLWAIQYKKLILSGWDLLEFWAIAFSKPRSKNALALESSVIESSTKDIKGLVKKIFLSRISTVFHSGSLHLELLNKLNYKGKTFLTRGVGVINKPEYQKKENKYQRKFLFLGRLSQEKNLEMLIEVFNALPDYNLSIVGNGELKDKLKAMSNSNINFLQHVDNTELSEVFASNDILILPSLSEPWGLVVEEALYFGMPVVISKNCGASELIDNDINGFVIDPSSFENINNVVASIDDNIFENLKKNIEMSFLADKDICQVSAYNEALK